jgi:hypothetical protein
MPTHLTEPRPQSQDRDTLNRNYPQLQQPSTATTLNCNYPQPQQNKNKHNRGYCGNFRKELKNIYEKEETLKEVLTLVCMV